MGNQNPRMEWDDLGHTIEQIVDRAIYAQD